MIPKEFFHSHPSPASSFVYWVYTPAFQSLRLSKGLSWVVTMSERRPTNLWLSFIYSHTVFSGWPTAYNRIKKKLRESQSYHFIGLSQEYYKPIKFNLGKNFRVCRWVILKGVFKPRKIYTFWNIRYLSKF